MTNQQLYLMALQKIWLVWMVFIGAILWTGLHEAVEREWDKRCKIKV